VLIRWLYEMHGATIKINIATVPPISCNNTAATCSLAFMTLKIISNDSACLSLYSAIFIVSGIPQESPIAKLSRSGCITSDCRCHLQHRSQPNIGKYKESDAICHLIRLRLSVVPTYPLNKKTLTSIYHLPLLQLDRNSEAPDFDRRRVFLRR